MATLLLDTTVHQVQPLQLRPCGSDMFHTRRRRPRHNSHQPQSDQTRGRPNVDTKRAPPNSGGARWYTSEAIFTRTSPPEAPKKCGHLASVLLIGNKMSTCPRFAVFWSNPANCRQKWVWTPPGVVSTPPFGPEILQQRPEEHPENRQNAAHRAQDAVLLITCCHGKTMMRLKLVTMAAVASGTV